MVSKFWNSALLAVCLATCVIFAAAVPAEVEDDSVDFLNADSLMAPLDALRDAFEDLVLLSDPTEELSREDNLGKIFGLLRMKGDFMNIRENDKEIFDMEFIQPLGMDPVALIDCQLGLGHCPDQSHGLSNIFPSFQPLSLLREASDALQNMYNSENEFVELRDIVNELNLNELLPVGDDAALTDVLKQVNLDQLGTRMSNGGQSGNPLSNLPIGGLLGNLGSLTGGLTENPQPAATAPDWQNILTNLLQNLELNAPTIGDQAEAPLGVGNLLRQWPFTEVLQSLSSSNAVEPVPVTEVVGGDAETEPAGEVEMPEVDSVEPQVPVEEAEVVEEKKVEDSPEVVQPVIETKPEQLVVAAEEVVQSATPALRRVQQVQQTVSTDVTQLVNNLLGGLSLTDLTKNLESGEVGADGVVSLLNNAISTTGNAEESNEMLNVSNLLSGLGIGNLHDAVQQRTGDAVSTVVGAQHAPNSLADIISSLLKGTEQGTMNEEIPAFLDKIAKAGLMVPGGGSFDVSTMNDALEALTNGPFAQDMLKAITP